MIKKIFLKFLLITLFACSGQENKNIYHSKYVGGYELKIVDTLIYKYKDSSYIGRLHDIQFYDGKILISDFFLKKLWIFSKELKLIKTVGGQGRGPGEYTYAPNILCDNNNVWLQCNRKIDKYNKNIEFVNRFDLPEEVIYKHASPISFGSYFIFNVVYPFSIANKSYFSLYKPLIKVDSNFQDYENFDDWDENYYDENIEGYTRERHETLVTKGSSNNFFSIQGATYYIKLFDERLNILEHFGRKPDNYKNPPRLKFRETQATVDANAEFHSNITIWHAIKYDSSNQSLFVGYTNLFKDFYLYRSLMRGKHYLQIFDKNYNVIFDGEIPGKLAFVEKGNIYIINQEHSQYLKILVCRLLRK